MIEETPTIIGSAGQDASPGDGDETPRASGPRRRSRGGRGRGGGGRPPKASGSATVGSEGEALVVTAEPDVTEEPAVRRSRSRTKKPATQAQAETEDGTSTLEAPAETVGEPSSRAPRSTGATRKPRTQAARRPSAATGTATEAPAGAEPAPVAAGGGTRDGLSAPERVPEGEEAAAAAPRKKRRRRGGRGRGKKKPTTAGIEREPTTAGEPEVSEGAELPSTEAVTLAAEQAPEGEEAAAAAPSRKRRRRGGRGRGKKPTTTAGTQEAVSPQPAERAEPAPQVSTRLRRARQTRTTTRRRREPLPVVPRVTDKLMVITEHGERDQIAVLEGRDLVQHYVTRIGARSMVGNVYLGRVQNVLPGMEAAFVDVGRGRNAVLYAGEVNYSPEDLEGSPPRIEKVLKSGQSVLVQVTKDPIGGKGARLTAQISMPGRYLVLVPNSNVTGISRRLPDTERRRLKTIYKKLKPEPHGLIVRTAAEGASEEALAADLRRLLEEWATIEKKAKKAKAPATLYEEPELTVRVVRDLFTDEEYRELVTDSPRVYEVVTDYLRQADPDVAGKVRLHDGRLPAFEEFHVVEQIHKGLDRKVWLPSGGYLVIDRTEALTVIDVNTGKSVGKTNLEETVVNTNLEAAREVARQLRLRDIGGMIVIDFIDMLLEQNKRRVIDEMKQALAQDKSRSQVFDISPLGLLEVTRKRVSGGLLESFSETCPTCEGRGVLLTYDVN